jgi:hypothetical protein
MVAFASAILAINSSDAHSKSEIDAFSWLDGLFLAGSFRSFGMSIAPQKLALPLSARSANALS